jgi:hypothetical protein
MDVRSGSNIPTFRGGVYRTVAQQWSYSSEYFIVLVTVILLISYKSVFVKIQTFSAKQLNLIRVWFSVWSLYS